MNIKFQHHLFKTLFFSLNTPELLTKIDWMYTCILVLEPTLSCYYIYLFLCQYHTVYSDLHFLLFFWNSSHMDVSFVTVPETGVASEGFCSIFFYPLSFCFTDGIVQLDRFSRLLIFISAISILCVSSSSEVFSCCGCCYALFYFKIFIWFSYIFCVFTEDFFLF